MSLPCDPEPYLSLCALTLLMDLSLSSSFPNKSCVTNSGQGQLLSTKRLSPVLDSIFQSHWPSQVTPANSRGWGGQPTHMAHASWIPEQQVTPEPDTVARVVQQYSRVQIGGVNGGEGKAGGVGVRQGEERKHTHDKVWALDIFLPLLPRLRSPKPDTKLTHTFSEMNRPLKCSKI